MVQLRFFLVFAGLIVSFGCSSLRFSEPDVSADVAAAEQDAGEAEVDENDIADGGEQVEAVPVDVPTTYTQEGTEITFTVPDSDLPVVVNERVLAWIDYFTGRGRPIFTRWLIRQQKIQPYIQDILKQYDLPLDLVYLSMIESGFNPKAFSHARASGLWQFMQATGRNYGLKVDYWIDERRDFEKATHAAARHLLDLHKHFGDWYLAMAAYNAGTAKVQRAIRKHDTRDFWELAQVKRPYLRAETRNYVPKLLAALIIGKQPTLFGFEAPAEVLDEEEFHPYTACEMVELSEPTDLAAIAKCAGVELETVLTLNPEIRYRFTPPGVTNYPLRLPTGVKERFLAEYEKLPKGKRITFARHVLQPGQTLGTVARRYGTTVAAIMKLNDIRNPRRLRAGKVILIPVPIGKSADLVSSTLKKPALRKGAGAAKSVVKDNAKRHKHVVRMGDTLWSLARHYGVSIHSLRRWNALRSKTVIYPGDVLTIYMPRV